MKHAFYIVLFIFIASCSTTIQDFDKYQKAPLLRTELMPSEIELTKKLPSVAVFDVQTNDAQAKSIGAPKFVEESIINILLSNKLAEIQDRKNLDKLQNEIRLSEISGNNANSSGIKSIDFAIDGSISGVSFSSRFLPEVLNTDGSVFMQDRYEYTAKVQGSIKIYSLPDLTVVENIFFHGTSTRTENVRSTGFKAKDFKFSAPVKPKDFDAGLAHDAVKNAIKNNEYKIKAAFAKTGYIMEKRTLGDKSIFLVNVGKNDGIKQEDKIDIIQKYTEINPLTGKTETHTRLVTKATVSDKIEDGRAWVVVKDQNLSSAIKLGDMAKITYNK